MKQFLLPFLTFFYGITIYAQHNSSIEKTIRDLEQIAVKGILNSDTTLLRQVWDENFMVNTPRNTIAKNRNAVFQNQKAGLINYSSFDRNIEQIEIQVNVVITMGYETYIPKTDLPEGKAGQIIKRRFTNIWMKKGKTWKQIARHASIICQS